MPMTIQSQKNGDNLVVHIGGKIDEDADFTACQLSGSASITVDFNQVQTINSCGIREWIKFIKTAPSAQFTYKNCPKVIVDQINMVDGFLPNGGVVESFYVPYFNEDMGTEKLVLFSKGKEYSAGKVNPPAEIQDDNGNVMEIDVIEAKYFKFVEKMK